MGSNRTTAGRARLPLVAIAAALALGACQSQEPAADNAAAAGPAVADEANVAALPVDNSGVDDAAGATADAPDTVVQVVTVPAVAADTPAADAAPVQEAVAAQSTIDRGQGITRVRHDGGWAWMRDGHVLRTASADGRRVSYFRNGEDRPYYVQEQDRGYVYANGRPTRAVDRRGRAAALDAQQRRDADTAAQQARADHDRAERHRADARPTTGQRASDTRGDDLQASDRDHRSTADHRYDDDHATPDASDRPTATRHPQPTPTPTANRQAHGRTDASRDRDRDARDADADAARGRDGHAR